MPPLTYHAGQLAIQEEAKTTHIAMRLASWIGPVAQFSCEADLLLFAMTNPDNGLAFTAVSGTAPLVTITSNATGIRHQVSSPSSESELSLRFDLDLSPRVSTPTPCGGLAISFANARRARASTAYCNQANMAPSFTPLKPLPSVANMWLLPSLSTQHHASALSLASRLRWMIHGWESWLLHARQCSSPASAQIEGQM